MQELELRFYSRDEIGAALGIPPKKDQFARDVKKRLADNGYSFEWVDRKGVIITGRSDAPEARLKALLVNRIGLDTQVDAVDFALFITAFSAIDDFNSMPWEERVFAITDYCGKYISQSTLQRWAEKLVESGNAAKFRKGALWHTARDANGDKHRRRVDPDSDEYRAYCDARTGTLKRLEEQGVSVKERWGAMIRKLYDELGSYYYCPETCLNALGEDAEEIALLVQEIIEKRKNTTD